MRYLLLFLICMQKSLSLAQESYQTLDSIQITSDSIMLDEVTIRGYRPSYQMTSEGLSTRVEGTVLSKLGTASDVLGVIPSIVRGEKIEVYGKGVPLIYVDGRQIYDTTELDQMKSEDIRNIELITSPGAKYDASVKAVIKIHTTHHREKGFGFDARSSYYQSENADIIEQLNWNYRHDRLDVFGTLYYKMENKCWNTSSNQTLFADTLWSLHFEQRSRTKTRNFRVMAGLNYSFNNNHSVGFQHTLILRPRTVNNNTIKSDIMADEHEYDHINNQIHDKEKYHPAHLLNLYYKGKIGKADIDFNGDYLYNKSEDFVTRSERSLYQDSRIVSSDNLVRNELFAAKLMINYPLLRGNFTIGGEYSYTRREDQYISYYCDIPTSVNNRKEQHITPFIEFSRNIYIGKLTVGLRYEYVEYNYLADNIHIEEQSHSFRDWFPHISLSSRFGKMRLQIAYMAKTLRPSYQQLSSNIRYANRYNLQSGNPFLNYEKIYDISITGIWKFLQFSLGYENRKDAILYWAKQHGSHTELTSYFNFPSLKNLYASINFSLILGMWSPKLDISVRKQIMSVQTDNGFYRMGQPVWQIKLDNIFNIGKGWITSVNTQIRTKGNWENYYWSRHLFYLDLNLSKSFLRDKMTIQLQAFDLLRMKRGAVLHTDFKEGTQISWTDNREIALTIRYKFNPSKTRYKGTGAGKAEKDRF